MHLNQLLWCTAQSSSFIFYNSRRLLRPYNVVLMREVHQHSSFLYYLWLTIEKSRRHPWMFQTYRIHVKNRFEIYGTEYYSTWQWQSIAIYVQGRKCHDFKLCSVFLMLEVPRWLHCQFTIQNSVTKRLKQKQSSVGDWQKAAEQRHLVHIKSK